MLVMFLFDLFLSFFRSLLSEVARPIVTKRCHMFSGDPDLQTSVQQFRGSLHKKVGGTKTSKFQRDFEQLHNLIVNISGLKQCIVDRKTALQTAITPVHAHLI